MWTTPANFCTVPPPCAAVSHRRTNPGGDIILNHPSQGSSHDASRGRAHLHLPHAGDRPAAAEQGAPPGGTGVPTPLLEPSEAADARHDAHRTRRTPPSHCVLSSRAERSHELTVERTDCGLGTRRGRSWSAHSLHYSLVQNTPPCKSCLSCWSAGGQQERCSCIRTIPMLEKVVYDESALTTLWQRRVRRRHCSCPQVWHAPRASK